MASKNTSLYGWCFLLAGMSSASGALPFYRRAGHLLCSHQLPVCVTGEWSFLQGTQAYQLSITQKKRALCLGRRYEKMLLTHSFLFRCVSQPPPLRGTSFHRKEGEPCPCIAFPYCHFERKREIFFVAVNKKREGIGKRETRYSIRYFLCSGITAFHLGIKNPLKQFGYLRCLL